MIRNISQTARESGSALFREGWGPLRSGAALVALVWLVAMVAVTQAAEFASPPGINVARQEAQIRAQVMRNAKDLVGPGLVDVIVNVSYAKKDTGKPDGKIKLPGFDRYITIGAENKVDIQAEYLRLRQVFVIVKDSLKADKDRIEKELNSSGRFVRAEGDSLRVVTLSDSGALRKRATEEGKEGEEATEVDEKRRLRRKPGGPSNEPESTVHLLRARTAYFKEDYNRALDHILKAIEVEPKSAMAYSMLGSLYYTINWKHLALKYWEMALDLDPENRELEELVANTKNSN